MTSGTTMLVQFEYMTEAVSTVFRQNSFADSLPSTRLSTFIISADRSESSIMRTVSVVRSI